MLKLIEHVPIVLFIGTYFMFGFFTATQTFVISTLFILILQVINNPKQPIKNYLNSLLVVILGGVTLLTNNPVYIIWAPTVKYIFAASAIITSRVLFKQSLMERGFKLANLHAPNYAWQRLDYALAICFLLMAFINIQVFKNYGSEVWTKFKIYSLFGWILLFIPIIIHIESKSHETQP